MINTKISIFPYTIRPYLSGLRSTTLPQSLTMSHWFAFLQSNELATLIFSDICYEFGPKRFPIYSQLGKRTLPEHSSLQDLLPLSLSYIYIFTILLRFDNFELNILMPFIISSLPFSPQHQLYSQKTLILFLLDSLAMLRRSLVSPLLFLRFLFFSSLYSLYGERLPSSQPFSFLISCWKTASLPKRADEPE